MAAHLIRDFLKAVGLIHKGKVKAKLDAEMQKVLDAVDQHPEETAIGVVQLTVTVRKMGDRLDIVPKVESKLPKEKGFGPAAFWLVDGALSLQHPDQDDMFSTREVRPRESDSAS
ncbi:hypothetical protein [Xanthobacter sediminis]